MTIFQNDIMTKTTLFDKVFFQSWILLEKHSREHCNCSYCQNIAKESRNISLWLPTHKGKTSWRVIAIKKPKWYYYLRCTLPTWGALFGFELDKWGTADSKKWRLRLGGFGMGKNSVKGLITIISHKHFISPTMVPHVESMLWVDIRSVWPGILYRVKAKTGAINETCGTGGSSS